MKRLLVTLFLLILLFVPREAAAGEAEEYFAEGQRLLQIHCADCDRATRLGLQSAIDAIKQAIDRGYADQAAAYKLLAKGYNTLALVHALPDSEERAFIRGLQEDVYKHLVEIAPNDAEVRVRYSLFLLDAAARLEHAQAAAKLAPESSETQFLLAMTLLETGKVDEALPIARTAIGLAHYTDVNRYAVRLGEQLERAGRSHDAALLRAEAKRKAK